MDFEYSQEELELLHNHLYKITAEVDRICRKHGIKYFIIGGTAIGAYFWEGIIPWDDDIDIGMQRGEYERFLEVAPQELNKDFFLQWVETDEHTPFWFAKLRENHTLFKEEQFKQAQIHHGIYVDLFPFDKIPSQAWLERLQYAVFGFFNACFIGKDIWQWKHFGKSQVDMPRERGYLACLLTRIVVITCSKRFLYQLVKYSQTFFNRFKFKVSKNIMTETDKVLITDIEQPQEVRFGHLTVMAPRGLETYLHTHYPVLVKDLPKKQQINHRPVELSFDTRE